MATTQSTADFILDQLMTLTPACWVRKMFGEYALYYGDVVVGLICNNRLFIKITDGGLTHAKGRYRKGYAYPGARVSMKINEDNIEEHEWLCELVQITAQELPLSKKKTK